MVTKKISSAVTVASGSLIAAFVLLFPSSVAFAQADHVRWDIISLAGTPPTVTEGGNASALAEDGSEITLTGNGTFVAPGGGKGGSGAATGGGDWETRDGSGNVTGSGTYEVTGLVLWKLAPGTPPAPTDLIGDPAERAAGLAVLTIEYDDGDRGILVVSCHLVGTPDSVFEGVNASKGFVHYYDSVAPVAGTDANRTLFHVRD